MTNTKKVITAVTFQASYNRKYEKDRDQRDYASRDFSELHTVLHFAEGEFSKCARLMSKIEHLQYLKEEIDIVELVDRYFDLVPSKKIYTKRKRTYSISFLTIHEEDCSL